MPVRPDPQREVPDGFELVAVADPDWRPVIGKRCRRRGGPQMGVAGNHLLACGKPSVAELNRGRYVRYKRVDSWWAYCPAHLYGRWFEDGKVMVWILRAKTDG
jgi:hypothetical protein